MKKSITALWIILSVYACSISVLFAQNDTTPTVIRNEAGRLSEISQGKDLTDLTIEGEMNASDFAFLREQSVITKLNLLDAEIVAGGEMKVNYDTIVTEPNVMPAYFLFYSKLGENLQELVLPINTTKIDRRSLQTAQVLTSIELPEGLLEIGELALCDASQLADIELPSSLEKIGPFAFWGCTSIGSLSIPEEVKTIEDGAFSGCTSLSSIELKSIIHIPNECFKGCTSLDDLGLSPMLESIGKKAFLGCSSLRNLPTFYLLNKIGEEAFKDCVGINSIEISLCPLKSIETGVFQGCTSLTNILLPSSVEYIGPYAFAGCSALSKLILPGQLKKMMGGSFARSGITFVDFPNKLESIPYAAFAHCKALKYIKLPTNLKNISEKAFGGCDQVEILVIDAEVPPAGDLEGLTDLAGVNNIELQVLAGKENLYKAAEGWKSFTKVGSLQSFEFEVSKDNPLLKQVKERLGGNDFEQRNLLSIYNLTLSGNLSEDDLNLLPTLANLYKLDLTNVNVEEESPILTWEFGRPVSSSNTKFRLDFPIKPHSPHIITMPQNMTAIRERAFANCFMLEKVNFASPLSVIGSEAFQNCGWLLETPNLSSLEILDSWSFAGCSSLKKVDFPQTVDEIKEYTFFGCSNIEEIVLPNNCTHIGEAAFAACAALLSIELPATIEEIGDNAFYGSPLLKKLVVKATTPPVVYDFTFAEYNYEQTELIVPKSENDIVLEDYKDANIWQKFKLLSTKDFSHASTFSPNLLHIYGGKQSLVIINDSDEYNTATIYKLDGNRMCEFIMQCGRNEKSIPSGTYIIVINNSSQKVIVR